MSGHRGCFCQSQRGNDFENCTADSLAQRDISGIFQGSVNSSSILFCTCLMLIDAVSTYIHVYVYLCVCVFVVLCLSYNWR